MNGGRMNDDQSYLPGYAVLRKKGSLFSMV